MVMQTGRSAPAGARRASSLAGIGATLALLFGIACYVLFVGAFVYLMGFVENAGALTGLDSGRATGSLSAPLIDLALLGLFAAQHSVMARKRFKALWTRIIPRSVERSVYVLLASASLALLCWQWRPLPGVVWQVSDALGRAALVGLSLVGWALVFISSFLINHFDLLGLRQVYLAWSRRGYASIPFRLTTLYRLVRHPMMLGFLIAFWAAPRMTTGHLLFALVTTIYILAAVRFLEERDLARELGPAYVAYQRKTPMILPFFGRWGMWRRR